MSAASNERPSADESPYAGEMGEWLSGVQYTIPGTEEHVATMIEDGISAVRDTGRTYSRIRTGETHDLTIPRDMTPKEFIAYSKGRTDAITQQLAKLTNMDTRDWDAALTTEALARIGCEHPSSDPFDWRNA